MKNEEVAEEYFFKGERYLCPLELAMDLIGGKWRTLAIYHLGEGALRSGELKKFLPDISNKMFTQTLRDLESSGLVQRKVYPVVPPKVEYSLTHMGEPILPIIEQFLQWGMEVGTGNIK